MGGIFIYKKNTYKNINPAKEMFDEMGFKSPTLIDAGKWIICAYSKMINRESNIVSNGLCTLVSVGTPIYKGLDYSDSLNALLQDSLSGRIDYNKLLGQYTLLFCHKENIDILCDPLGSKHLFTDNGLHVFSSHMLPVCQCIEGNIHINKKAVYEKLLTGIIMSPYTLFEEVIQIDKQMMEYISNEDVGIKFIRWPDIQISKTHVISNEKCLAEQAETLRDYFTQLNMMSKNGIDIGLSGGYDSRLVLACLHKYSNGKMHLHSHSTENVHQADLSIAKQMAEYVDIPCHTVTTQSLFHCKKIDEILRKSVLYFDGRSSFSIGGCGEVYTASYRMESTEKTPFTLTGVGGELYRNVFDIGYKRIRFSRFMEDKVFLQSFRKAISNGLYLEIKDDILNRTAARLGIEKNRKYNKSIAHRYYCEIMMPDGQGVALDAYNQVSCCIAPFLEPQIIQKGYETIPFHYSGGEFEGKLIRLIDPDLAALPSTYGYPIAQRPIKAKIKEKMRAYIPTSLWNQLATMFHKNMEISSTEKALDELYANSQTIKDAYIYLTELFPEIDFHYLLFSKEDVRRVQFIAMTLYYLKERISIQ